MLRSSGQVGETMDQRKIDEHRRKVLIRDRDSVIGNSGKTFINTSLELIKEVLIVGRGEFTEEQMLKNLRGFLQRERGIVRIGNGRNPLYEINKELVARGG